MSKPCKVHKQAAKRTLRYLRTTQHYALTYYYDPSSPISISGYVDANWAGDDPRCFSMGGYVFTLAGGHISWQTKRQSSIASSSTEAEYVAAALASREALWISELIIELKLPFNVSTAPITLFCDNQSTITLAESPSFSSKLKHIKISFHFLKELVANGFIKLVYVPSTKNWADFLTKSVPATKQTASSHASWAGSRGDTAVGFLGSIPAGSRGRASLDPVGAAPQRGLGAEPRWGQGAAPLRRPGAEPRRDNKIEDEGDMSQATQQVLPTIDEETPFHKGDAMSTQEVVEHERDFVAQKPSNDMNKGSEIMLPTIGETQIHEGNTRNSEEKMVVVENQSDVQTSPKPSYDMIIKDTYSMPLRDEEVEGSEKKDEANEEHQGALATTEVQDKVNKGIGKATRNANKAQNIQGRVQGIEGDHMAVIPLNTMQASIAFLSSDQLR
ncbi:hypothetical protein L7F22_038427 [Adiantum nelumboides]|nr:hypothetical protein [Adiantum nelumboides]